MTDKPDWQGDERRKRAEQDAARKAATLRADEAEGFVNGFRVRDRDAPAPHPHQAIVDGLPKSDRLKVRETIEADGDRGLVVAVDDFAVATFWASNGARWACDKVALVLEALSRPATPAQAGESCAGMPGEPNTTPIELRERLHAAQRDVAQLRAERDRLAERVRELEGPQSPTLTQLERELVTAACVNVDAWRESVWTEAHGSRNAADLRTRSDFDAAHYEAKAKAKRACVELCDAVDAVRKAAVPRG